MMALPSMRGRPASSRCLTSKDTRLKVVSTNGDMQQIEVVDGANVTKTGWIDKGQIKDEG